MLAQGRKSRPYLNFSKADALNLPFDDDYFDVATISFGLRNTVDYHKALAEALRVVKKGGRMVVVEFSHPTWRPFRTLYMGYLMRALPAIAKKTASNPDAYVYLAQSIRAWPDQVGLAKAMELAGWSSVTWKNLTFGVVTVHIGIKG
jgi:demethylmenaquinone methyltransferase/2-methoxy-6-polyprenyl-1,4-benzoquinol methylase